MPSPAAVGEVRHNELLWRLESVNDQLAALRVGQADIIALLKTETLRDIQQETDMAKKLAEIVTDMEKNAADQIALITEQTTVIQGVEVHLQGQAAVIAGLKQQVKELIEAGGDPAQLAKLEQLAASMDAAEAATKANTDKVTAAILANTEDGGSQA